jgi:hypothetical protein
MKYIDVEGIEAGWIAFFFFECRCEWMLARIWLVGWSAGQVGLENVNGAKGIEGYLSPKHFSDFRTTLESIDTFHRQHPILRTIKSVFAA